MTKGILTILKSLPNILLVVNLWIFRTAYFFYLFCYNHDLNLLELIMFLLSRFCIFKRNKWAKGMDLMLPINWLGITEALMTNTLSWCAKSVSCRVYLLMFINRVKYFRPISLVTIVYKIIAKVLAGKLKKVLSLTISISVFPWVHSAVHHGKTFLTRPLLLMRLLGIIEDEIFKISFEGLMSWWPHRLGLSWQSLPKERLWA